MPLEFDGYKNLFSPPETRGEPVTAEELATNLAIVDGKVVTVDGKVVGVASDVAVVDGKIVGVDGKVDTTLANISTLDGKVVTVDGKVVTVTTDVATLDGKVVTVDGKVVDVGDDVSIVDGKVVVVDATTDDILARLGIVIATKTGGESLSEDTTLQDDDDLFLSMIANSTYEFELTIDVEAQNTVPDMDIDFSVPSGTVGGYTWVMPTTGDSGIGVIGVQERIPLDTPRRPLLITGVITTSSTTGNLQFKWAQGVSNASIIYVWSGFITLTVP